MQSSQCKQGQPWGWPNFFPHLPQILQFTCSNYVTAENIFNVHHIHSSRMWFQFIRKYNSEMQQSWRRFSKELPVWILPIIRPCRLGRTSNAIELGEHLADVATRMGFSRYLFNQSGWDRHCTLWWIIFFPVIENRLCHSHNKIKH